MLETLKKILKQEEKDKKEVAEKDYYFEKEIKILIAQKKLNEIKIGEDDDKGN